MTIKIGINGFGRIGRLIFRTAFDWDDIEFIHVNDLSGDAKTFAHLLNFDSIHGRWHFDAKAEERFFVINDEKIGFTKNEAIRATDWSNCDIVIDASGKMKTKALLQAYLDQGVKRVIVTAPVNEEGILNIVMGVNQHLYDPAVHSIVTASSCTTNCIAPVVKVLQEALEISHGSITTIHNITNTQSVMDTAHLDLRRARGNGMSLIPTTTGSAKAITDIFPELKGKLNGHAIRVPLANASLTDCVFEVKRETTGREVNELFKVASKNELKGILGYEERPLVSVDYRTDPRSTIVDAPSTLVINGTHIKLYAWYDNEWGYANRTAELARMIGET